MSRHWCTPGYAEAIRLELGSIQGCDEVLNTACCKTRALGGFINKDPALIRARCFHTSLPLEKAQPDPRREPFPWKSCRMPIRLTWSCGAAPAGRGVQLETPTPGWLQPLQASAPDARGGQDWTHTWTSPRHRPGLVAPL